MNKKYTKLYAVMGFFGISSALCVVATIILGIWNIIPWVLLVKILLTCLIVFVVCFSVSRVIIGINEDADPEKEAQENYK